MSKRSYKLNKHGFTLVELIIVMTIIGILMVGSVLVYNTQQKNARIDTVEGNLVIFKADYEAYLEDYGVFTVDTGLSNAEQYEVISDWLQKLSSNYLHTSFDVGDWSADDTAALGTLELHGEYFTVETRTEDPWGQRYLLYYSSDPSATNKGTAILASRGPDLTSDPTLYKAGQFSDDILVVVVPK
jgi:prepilin-type N-terminal cleavage/methylation domain-containing protein